MARVLACPTCGSALVILRTVPRARVTLTRREEDVQRLFAGGMRVRQIARALGVSVHTSRSYVKRLMTKYGVHSQAELLERLRRE